MENIERIINDRIKLACISTISFNNIIEIAKPILLDAITEFNLKIDTRYIFTQTYNDRCIVDIGCWPKFGNGICLIAYYPPQKIDDINSGYSIADPLIYEVHMNEH